MVMKARSLRLKSKDRVKAAPPPPPLHPKAKDQSGAEDNRHDAHKSKVHVGASAKSVPKTIRLGLTGNGGRTSRNNQDARDDASLSSGLTDTTFSSSEASLKLPPPPPPRRTGLLATHPEASVKAVVLLQAAFRGRKARKKYALMRWYRGLDKSPSKKSPVATATTAGKKIIPSANRSVFLSRPIPKTKTTVKSTTAASSTGSIIFGSRPSAARAAAATIPAGTTSMPVVKNDSPSSPNKNPSAPAHSKVSLLERSMKAIEGAIFSSEESEQAQRCAAAAKKILLGRTADYIAYLNALLKAHANEEILSRNEGIDAIVNELLCFLAMKAIGKSPVPSIKIHRAWRIMVQSRPFVYIEMCKAMGASSGFSIDDETYDPEEDGHNQETNMIKEKYEYTKSAYTTLFLSNPPAEFWPSTNNENEEVSSIPANHLEFLHEENLPRQNDDLFSEIGSDAMTSVSGMTYDDDSLATMEPAALLSELQYLAEEQNIDIANLSYDSIVDDLKKLRVWVDKTFF